jgi:DNA-binding MarR family transcriptional regulator
VKEQAGHLEAVLPEIMRRLFPLAMEHAIADMPIGQLRVCAILLTGPLSLSIISEELGISSSAMTQIADRLERAGLVERVFEADDRRVRLLQLSAHGRAAMEARRRARVARAQAALCGIDPKARETLLCSLDGLAAASLEAVPAADAPRPKQI